MTASTLRQVEGFVQVKSLGTVQAKGISRPVEAHELLGATAARTRIQASAARGLTPLVGRRSEIDVFNKLVEQAAARRGQILALVGEPGMGKSRLVHEFIRHQLPPGWLVLEGPSVSYGKAMPYFPLIEMLHRYFQITDRDASETIQERVVRHVLELDDMLKPTIPPLLLLLGASPEENRSPASVEHDWLAQHQDLVEITKRFDAMNPQQRRRHTLDSLKGILIRESQRQPLLTVFEDLHWIDSETQAFLDSLVESLPTTRILLLVDYRPEYSQGWGDRTYYTQLRVDALNPPSAEELLQHLLGRNTDLGRLTQLLLQRTEGNPFFAEESIRSLVETGILVGEKGAYLPGLRINEIKIPSTVQNVVADRIDRLPIEEKRVLQTAAVIGPIVPFSLLEAVSDLADEDLRRYLSHLQTAEFLYETNLFPELEYSFKHAITGEVAYGELLLERRTLLHAKTVSALEKVAGDNLRDHIETLAHHAYHGELWEKAVLYLRQTASRAMDRCAYRNAAGCLDRALLSLKKLPQNHETMEQMIDLRLDFRTALFPLEELNSVIEHLLVAESLAESLGDRLRLGRTYGYLVHYYTGLGDRQKANTAADKGLSLAAELNDPSLEIQLNYYLGRACYATGDYNKAIVLLRRNVDVLGRQHKLEAHFDMECPPSILCRAILVMCLAETGELASAINIGTEAFQIATDIEHTFGAIYAESALGIAYMRRGDFDSAVSVLERGLNRCLTADIPAQFPLVASPLGLAYARTGRIPEGINLLEQVIHQTASKRTGGQAFRVAWLAEAYLRAGRIVEAMARSQLALEFAQHHGEKGREGWILRLIAMIHDRQNPRDVETIESHYRQALTLAGQLGMRPLQAHCHFGLGELFTRRQ